tara:strand:+ start:246 stop:653 length:408 start_codon:yes stop_codon:yes gene_type:complete
MNKAKLFFILILITGCAGIDERPPVLNKGWTWEDGSYLRLEGHNWTPGLEMSASILVGAEVDSPACQIRWIFFNGSEQNASIWESFYLTKDGIVIDEDILSISAPPNMKKVSDYSFIGEGESYCTDAEIQITPKM